MAGVTALLCPFCQVASVWYFIQTDEYRCHTCKRVFPVAYDGSADTQSVDTTAPQNVIVSCKLGPDTDCIVLKDA